MDKAGGPISYLEMLPRYDEENLAISLAQDPGLRALALKYGPKPAPPAQRDKLYYVSVLYTAGMETGAIRARKIQLRDELNGSSRTSQYPLQVMKLRKPRGLILIPRR